MLEAKNKHAIVTDVKDFEGAEESTWFSELQNKIVNKRESILVDEVEAKRAEDWSLLAHQVVGSESL